MNDKRIRWIVRFTGHVQGVGFRMTAVSQSQGLRVHGRVRNEPDGSVEMDVEGPPADMHQLVRRIESAMSGHIDAVTKDDREPTGKEGGLRIAY